MPKSIILEPHFMYQTLDELQNETKSLLNKLKEVGELLQIVARMTYAIGFNDLMKDAETQINGAGHAFVAANNVVDGACREVVKKLVQKFASEAGVRDSYAIEFFQEISIQTNFPERVQINPHYMSNIFDSYGQKIIELSAVGYDMQSLYARTHYFWQGTAADRTREAFETSVMPVFEKLMDTLYKIYGKGRDWVDEAIKMEASLQTP